METAPQINVTVGQPLVIDCRDSFASNVQVGLNWELSFGAGNHPISLSEDRAITGLNGSLYLLEPKITDNNRIYFCRITILDFGFASNGYVKLSVHGKLKLERREVGVGGGSGFEVKNLNNHSNK